MLVTKPAVITAEWKKMQILNMSGNQIEFTKLEIGSGLYSDEETIKEALSHRTSLKDRKQVFGISSMAVSDDGKTLIFSIMITNADLSEGYTIRELGLYARIKDQPDTECMVSISLAEIEDDFPAYDGTTSESRILMKYQFTVSESDTVYLSYEHDPVALVEDVDKKINELNELIEEAKALRASLEVYGLVKVTDSSAVTDSAGLALAATEKNASIDGTLANKVSQLSNPNLLINPDFRINQRGGKIVESGKNYYSDESCGTLVSATTSTYTATIISNGNYSISIDSTTYYVKASDVVDGYCGNGKFTVDRWTLFNYDTRMWVKPKGSGGITLCLGKQSGNVFAYKYNHIEKDNIDIDMACKTGLTCSVSINGNICSVYFSGEDIKEKKQTGFWSEPLYTNDNAGVHIQFIPQWGDVTGFIGIGMIGTPSNDVVIDVEWVKLELGSVATPFVPPDPATELMKCQRYYQKIQTIYTSSFANEENMYLRISFNFPTKMRIVPSISAEHKNLNSLNIQSAVYEDGVHFFAVANTRNDYFDVKNCEFDSEIY